MRCTKLMVSPNLVRLGICVIIYENSPIVDNTRRNSVQTNLGQHDLSPKKCINKSIWLAPGGHLPWVHHGYLPGANQMICLSIFWVTRRVGQGWFGQNFFQCKGANIGEYVPNKVKGQFISSDSLHQINSRLLISFDII